MASGLELWLLNSVGRRRGEEFDVKCLIKALGVSVVERIRNIDIKERCGNKRSLLELVDQIIVELIRHMERVDVGRLVKKYSK